MCRKEFNFNKVLATCLCGFTLLRYLNIFYRGLQHFIICVPLAILRSLFTTVH